MFLFAFGNKKRKFAEKVKHSSPPPPRRPAYSFDAEKRSLFVYIIVFFFYFILLKKLIPHSQIRGTYNKICSWRVSGVVYLLQTLVGEDVLIHCRPPIGC